ncbi:hypothetical protein C8J56DRAFT_787588 [Mycena floridula]|nr:hypothetical protein C8J56DRAFT_787588 [Mycena floridula]
MSSSDAAAPIASPLDPDAPSITENSSVIDPPPPYPSRTRRSRAPRSTHNRRSGATGQSGHGQISSADSHSSGFESLPPVSPLPHHHPFVDHDLVEANETTALLGSSPRRPRSASHGSVFSSTSAAPSLARTLVSMFNSTDDDADDDEFDPEHSVHYDRHPFLSSHLEFPAIPTAETSRRKTPLKIFSGAAWRRYFRPMGRNVYWNALFHLLVVNFPFTLVAWLFLFVFTVAGTTLLVTLPLGVILCFLNLLGARTLSRCELALQTKFHVVVAYPPPYPPRPLFTRFRDASVSDIEAGRASPGGLVPETSFYKNTYAMASLHFFTDPISYQALFYFLVIKAAITLTLTLVLLILVVPAMVLVLPAPAALRAVRKIGVWQANIAVEGLYFAVR